jgi:hypothetical protein
MGEQHCGERPDRSPGRSASEAGLRSFAVATDEGQCATKRGTPLTRLGGNAAKIGGEGVGRESFIHCRRSGNAGEGAAPEIAGGCSESRL